MKENKVLLNSFTGIIYQVLYIIYGFIIPRLILRTYGSETNGLISSINQFLIAISLTEFGLTSVIQTSLYKPLVEKDYSQISKIVTAASKIFKRIGILFGCYILSLIVLYPHMIKTSFNSWYIRLFIIILALDTLVQYLFGLSAVQLLTSDQKIHVVHIINCIILIFEIISGYILVYYKFDVILLKLFNACIFLLNPIVVILYVKREYPLVSFNIGCDYSSINHKRSGIYMHISNYVFSSTDVLIISLLLGLKYVSVYAIYNLIFNSIKQLSSSLDGGIKPALGQLWANGKKEVFKYKFMQYELIVHSISITFYCVACILILPFIKLYTKGINDISYIIPSFAFMMAVSYCIQNIKSIYHNTIQALGTYKETKYIYLLAAILNILLSLILVKTWGLNGVVLGTIIGVSVQVYLMNKHCYDVLNIGINRRIKLFIYDFLMVVIAISISKYGNFLEICSSYLIWLGCSILALVFVIVIESIIGMVFWKKDMKILLQMLRKNER